jgi:hypothetical protein
VFDLRKFGQLFALSSVFVGSFLTALSATATNDVLQTEKLGQQPSVVLASSEKQGNVQLEELEVPMLSDGERSFPDDRFIYYNDYLRGLKLLPSRGHSIEIRTEDNDLQRLLKQQLNDALEIYQIVGQLLNSGELDINLFAPSTLPAIQVAIAETDFATNSKDRELANKVGLKIAQKWEKNNMLLNYAGLGTRSNVLEASYYRKCFEIQRMKLEIKNLNSSPIRESQVQEQRSIELEEIKPISFQDSEKIENLPMENRERARQFRREVNQIINPAISYYNANVKLLKLIPRRQSLEIRTEDSNIQKLQKQQLYEALDYYRLRGLRLNAGLLDDDSGLGISAEIMLPAIQVLIADMNLATNPNERAVAIETGLKIAQTWEKDAVFQEKTTLRKRIVTLTASYWRRYFEIQKLLTESNDQG